VDVYTTNKRCVIPIETKEFGTVIMIAVGATMVGSIHFCCPKNGMADCKTSDGVGCCCAAEQPVPVKKKISGKRIFRVWWFNRTRSVQTWHDRV